MTKACKLSLADAISLCDEHDVSGLMRRAASLRDEGHGRVVTYSRKVFLPVAHLCRDSCHYCSFARSPHRSEPAYMTAEDIQSVAQRAATAGCREALFTLGDKPELRYAAARSALSELGFASTRVYLREMAAMVLTETGLLSHLNPGVLTRAELSELRSVSASMGLMLETASLRSSQ